MAEGLGRAGVLNVVSPAALEEQLQKQAADKAAAAQPEQPQDVSALSSYIRGQFDIFRNHRNTAAGWSDRMLSALRIFNGQYDPTKLQQIKKFGGSEIYARIIAQKCRAASSLLRDIYLGPDMPWAVKPPADPDVPPEIEQKIKDLLTHEQGMMQQQGVQASDGDFRERQRALIESAKDAAKKRAAGQARDSQDKIEGILRDGGFYHALAEILVDLPIFPFACLKGPVVRVVPTVTWPPGGGQPTVKQTPKLTWHRVSPFDLWWDPGVGDIENANVIEKQRLTRAELNELLDLPGYNQDEIRAVLDEYGRGGLYDNWDTTDAERAVLESRENPAWNRSALISMMEFNGNVQGRLLQEYGLAVDDELRDYHIQAWCVGTHVIKAHLSPSPRQRHPYFITSFEKVPGTPLGNGLTDLLADLQEAGNATLRALINNLSISSGPQVVIDDDRLVPDENPEELYPWKRWHVRNNPVGNNSAQPVQFFMPTSNAQQLLQVFKAFQELADDVSAIPKYVGGQAGSGAGRTASGLAMLMGNASKILQTVSANLDRDVVEPALMQLTDLILLTDTSGLLTGEEKISVQGVVVAMQRETIRQRQVEFLQATNNAVDMKIVGYKGRGAVLRSVGRDLGLDGETIVPPDDVLEKMQQADQQKAQNAPIEQAVEKGVQAGIQSGIQKITAAMTEGGLAAQGNVDMEIHPLQPSPMPHTNEPGMDLGRAAAISQGTQPSRISGHEMGPTLALTGNQPGPGSLPVHGGVG